MPAAIDTRRHTARRRELEQLLARLRELPAEDGARLSAAARTAVAQHGQTTTDALFTEALRELAAAGRIGTLTIYHDGRITGAGPVWDLISEAPLHLDYGAELAAAVAARDLIPDDWYAILTDHATELLPPEE